jgi:hypothetical protein
MSLLITALALCGGLRSAPSELDVPAALARFEAFDQNGDGVVEIARLERLASRDNVAGAKRVVVFVEPRVLAPLEGGIDLRPRIERLADDLAREGRAALVLAVEFHDAGHRDGRLVLALREVLREFAKDESHALEGALLVGHFPDALVVRTIDWWQFGDDAFPRADGGSDEVKGVHLVRRIPEAVAMRGDVVLGDLDGRWEDVYVEAPTAFEIVVAAFGEAPPATGALCTHVRSGAQTFADCFHVIDGKLVLETRGDGVHVVVDPSDRDRECSDADRALGNPLPRPDVGVGRIDARGTAYVPRRDVRGADGGGLVDERGRARAVEFVDAASVPHWRDALYEFDARFERELLADFLDRNHAYRTGSAETAWRAASLAHDLWSGYGVVRAAAGDWSETDDARADVHGRPSIAQALDWLRYPALLRTVRAHSDPWGSVFDGCDASALDTALADSLMAWTPKENRLVPSLGAASAGGKLDWFLLRSLWRSSGASTSPSFYLHTGCEAITPFGILGLAYDDPSYGVRQGAEALLFFGNGLALVGRAKVFYDEPPGFCEALGAGATFGDAWRRGFEIEAAATDWDHVGGDIGRKRTLFWSVLGDFTLRLERPRGA